MLSRSLSISLVVYHPKHEVLAKCLQHLTYSLGLVQENFNLKTKLYLIDNSTQSISTQTIKRLLQRYLGEGGHFTYEYIKNENVGYGRANNKAIQRINTDYHLVLNPDVFVESDTFQQALQYMEQHSAVGLLSPAVFGENGQRHYLLRKNPTVLDMFLRSFAPHFIRQWFQNRMLKYEYRDHDYEQEIIGITAATGCFMFCRASVLKRVDGFDPRYFMYFEDADLARKISQIAEIAYVPSVKIIHQWSRGTHHSWRLKWITIQSAISYWRKWGWSWV